MPVPSSIDDLSQTAGSNSPPGSESPTTADDYLRTYAAFIAILRDGKGHSDEVQVASAATADIGAANSLFVEITGTTTITSFGTTYNGPRFVRFSGALTLTHNATSLIIPGGANVTTAAGDCAVVIPNNGAPNGWRVVLYQRASSSPVTIPLPTTQGGSGSSYADAAALFAGIKQAASETDTGVIELATTAEAQAGTDTVRAITPARLRDAFNASGSAPVYACRAWVNFNGTGTVAIRASGNVSSITDTGTGAYTVNFTTAMPDANYAMVATAGNDGSTNAIAIGSNGDPTVNGHGILVVSLSSGTAVDTSRIRAAFFR
jgi:hypothetical protein